jgi:hypothetical protein
MADQDGGVLRGRNVVVTISFRDAFIYVTDSETGVRPERVIAPDPHGRYHKVHHKAGNLSGTYEDDSPAYWKDIADELAPAGAILLFGHGKGKGQCFAPLGHVR